MAFVDSEKAVFKITDTGGQSRDMTAHITRIRGLPGPRRLNSVTTLGDGGDKWNPGLEGATITIDLLYSKDSNTGSDTVFGPLRTHNAATAFEWHPGGTAAGEIKYTGTCWVEDFDEDASTGSLVKGQVVIKVEGKVTRGTN